MAGSRDKPRSTRAVVCGTGFGRIYLSAFAHPECPLRLAGILGRGSARSRACAERLGVPLLTNPAAVREIADVACVVVPNGVSGGAGASLAQELLAQGVHVLHEHPIHTVELSACLRAARRTGTQYQLNTFYPDLEPVRRFLAAARHLRGRQAVSFAEAACATHVSFDTIDILGQALGGLRPWQLGDPAPVVAPGATREGPPFRTVEGVLHNVPVTLRVLHQLDPEDPDNHTHLLHRVTLGFSCGTLMLASTHGPVLWNPALPAPRGDDGELSFDASAQEMAQRPSVSFIGPAGAPSYEKVYAELWPRGVCRALSRLVRSIEAAGDPLSGAQHLVTVSQIWQELTRRLGYPELVRRVAPEPVSGEQLSRALAAEEDGP